MTTNEMKKEQAINYLKQLDIYTPYINAFEKENKVCFFERFGGYWVEENSALYSFSYSPSVSSQPRSLKIGQKSKYSGMGSSLIDISSQAQEPTNSVSEFAVGAV